MAIVDLGEPPAVRGKKHKYKYEDWLHFHFFDRLCSYNPPKRVPEMRPAVAEFNRS